ncbi:hypothetical protein DENSPDRAFT_493629 [Dentipellis sp. KUC8613]|nr:hypothetical protein DENSPDRAFT_493629 [Dentipellis sp. KUC8613]
MQMHPRPRPVSRTAGQGMRGCRSVANARARAGVRFLADARIYGDEGRWGMGLLGRERPGVMHGGCDALCESAQMRRGGRSFLPAVVVQRGLPVSALLWSRARAVGRALGPALGIQRAAIHSTDIDADRDRVRSVAAGALRWMGLFMPPNRVNRSGWDGAGSETCDKQGRGWRFGRSSLVARGSAYRSLPRCPADSGILL